jgi:alpha-glucosidase (family GH31 glycosyl hydrolase)
MRELRLMLRYLALGIAGIALAYVTVAVLGSCTPAKATSLALTSGATKLDVNLAPFSLAFGAAKSATAGDTCAPLALALRSSSDTGAWHKPEKPTGDEIWLHAGTATSTDAKHARVDMLDATGAVKAHANVALTDAGDGWVNVDVTFDVDEVNVAYASACFALADHEHLVGGGERFDGPDLRGHVVPLYFDAPGEYDSGTNESHAPVPFFASSQGYAVLVDEERVGAFDVGVTNPNATALRFHGNALHLAIRNGAVVDDVAAFARRMGLPKPPPLWTLAPMQWRNSVDVTLAADGVTVAESGTDKVLADANEMRTRHIPASTIWIDAPWETGYNTFTVNDAQLPNFDAAMSTLQSQGFYVVGWATDNVNNTDDHDQAYGMPAFASKPMFDDFSARHLLVSLQDGTPFTFTWGRGAGGFVDFTNDAACSAYQDVMAPLLARGMRGFKLDYGETMRPDVVGLLPNVLPIFSDGTTTAVEHTRFARLYHACYLAALDAQFPHDFFVITRTGGIYDQKSGVAIWPGDLDATFTKHGDPVVSESGKLAVGGLPSAIGGFLSLAMSAYPLYGSDIGGYRGATAPSPELFARWAQFGAASTIMQTGNGANLAAWDDALVGVIDAYAKAARFHMDLLPTWQAWVARATTDGTPIAVPVGVVDGSEDAWRDSFSFVLGDALLVAPVIEEGAVKRSVFVPAGVWRSWEDDSVVVSGPGVTTIDAPLDRLPVFVRDDSVLVLSDPNLDTALPCASCSGDVDKRVVRAWLPAKDEAAHASAGDVVATRKLAGKSASLAVTSTSARAFIVDLRLGDHALASTSSVTIPGKTATFVTDEASLDACSDGCVLVEAHRVRASLAATKSAELDVVLQ